MENSTQRIEREEKKRLCVDAHVYHGGTKGKKEGIVSSRNRRDKKGKGIIRIDDDEVEEMIDCCCWSASKLFGKRRYTKHDYEIFAARERNKGLTRFRRR